jgi:hypothetical protein
VALLTLSDFFSRSTSIYKELLHVLYLKEYRLHFCVVCKKVITVCSEIGVHIGPVFAGCPELLT